VFKVVIDKSDYWCDVCGVRNKHDGLANPPVLAREMIAVQQKDPGMDRNTIFAHLDCFERKIAKAKATWAKESKEK
jgi:hypothetical protein